MKWAVGIIAAVGALWALLGGMFTGKWKKRANDTLDEAEEDALDSISKEGLIEKERILEDLDRTRGLSNDERLALALLRARIRRAEYDASRG